MSSYTVVLLVEQALTAADAAQVRSLHEGIDGEVRYRLLLPVETTPVGRLAGLGAIGVGEALQTPTPPPLDEADVARLQAAQLAGAQEDLTRSVDRLRLEGATVEGTLVTTDPVDALVEAVTATGAGEVIVMTMPHLIREFFHQDWASQARRRLGVPVLHLLEHESFDAQAGEGEGISGF